MGVLCNQTTNFVDFKHQQQRQAAGEHNNNDRMLDIKI